MSGWGLGRGAWAPPASLCHGTGDGRQCPCCPQWVLRDHPISGATTRTTTHLSSAGSQKSPQSFRLFLMMTSVTASKTNCTFLVSVAQVKWV